MSFPCLGRMAVCARHHMQGGTTELWSQRSLEHLLQLHHQQLHTSLPRPFIHSLAASPSPSLSPRPGSSSSHQNNPHLNPSFQCSGGHPALLWRQCRPKGPPHPSRTSPVTLFSAEPATSPERGAGERGTSRKSVNKPPPTSPSLLLPFALWALGWDTAKGGKCLPSSHRRCRS